MEIFIENIKELDEFAKRLVEEVTIYNSKQIATVVALSGELGVGKTALIKSIAQSLGIQEIVTSPTFSIMNIFPINNLYFSQLIHIDAYRLESCKEMQLLRWDEIIQNPKNLIFIEWPEKIKEILPPNYRLISIINKGDEKRIINDIQILNGKKN